MNRYILFIIFNIINITRLYASNIFKRIYFDAITLDRASLRYVIFKEKTLQKMIKNIKQTLVIYQNKSIASIAEGITSYNELSEDEKTLIEVVISLCY
jgi:hypothetical protein